MALIDPHGRTPSPLPTSLTGAHEWLTRYWPGRDATPEQFFVYHEFKAAVYQHVLDCNPREYEARYWVDQEHRLAVEYGPPDAAQRVAAKTGIGAGADVQSPPAPMSSTSDHEEGGGSTNTTGT